MVAGLLGIVLNLALLGPATLRSSLAGENDFRAFYIGGRLAGTHSLYNTQRVLEEQRRVFGEPNEHLLSTRPPFFYWLFRPLAKVPYPVAFLLWSIGQIAALAWMIWTQEERDRTVLACCWSLPLVFSILIGQDVVLLILCLGGFWWALGQRREATAGLLLSLCLSKFHLIWLVPWMLLLRREWRALAGFAAGAAGLLSLSFLAEGADWPRLYAATILNPEVSPAPGIMPNLSSLSAWLGWGRAFEYFAILAVFAVVTWVSLSNSPERALLAALLGGLLISSHVYLQDCALLLGPMLERLWTDERPGSARLEILLLLPIPYVAILTGRGWILALLILAALAECVRGTSQGDRGMTRTATRPDAQLGAIGTLQL